jgi:hypothetical protein
MTGGQIELWLKDHGVSGRGFSHANVNKNLNDLVTEGKLNNKTDANGKGYGLAEWSQESSEGD